MGTKITLPFILVFFTTVGIAQSRKQLQGKISVLNATTSDILVLNVNTQQEVSTDSYGSFEILAKAEDVLEFASPNFYYKQITVSEENFLISSITLSLTPRITVLDEVEIIDHKSYNAVDLGILQKPAKSYTPAERRLKTAGDFKPIHLLGLLGGSLELDPIFNAINGKTKRLKKEIILERNAKRFQIFQDYISDEELIEQLKIIPDDIVKFRYYVLDDKDFKNLLERRDKSKITFYLIQKYSKFQKNHKTDDN